MAKRKKHSLNGIFTRYYRAHPEWLTADNEIVLEQFKKDYPNRQIEKPVKQAMYNVKSRLKGGEEGRTKRKQRHAAINQAVASSKVNGKSRGPLGMLEEQIDDCMHLAKQIGREVMHDILVNLHRARNRVVMMVEG